MPTCIVCSHPLRHVADAMLTAGKPYMEVARQLAEPPSFKQAVGRHMRRGHVVPPGGTAPVVPVAPKRRGPLTSESSPEDIIRASLDEMRKADTSKMSPYQRSQHYDQMRRAAVDLNRVAAPKDLEGPAQKRVKELEDDLELVTAALEHFTDARSAVGIAMAHRAGRPWTSSRPTFTGHDGKAREFRWPGGWVEVGSTREEVTSQ
jgi:hypothetical protein